MIARCLLLINGAALVALAAFAPVPNTPFQRKPATHWQSQRSRDQLHRLVLAIHSYHDEHNRFPKDITSQDGKPLLSWRVAILPHLDLDFLYRQFKLDEPWDSEHNKRLLAFMPDLFRAPPQDRKTTDTFYQAVTGPGAVFDPAFNGTIQGIADGTVTTLLLVEAGPPVPWTKPADIPFDPNKDVPNLEGPYTDAIHVALADGSTMRMNPKPDPDLLKLFILRNDGTPLDTDKLKADPIRPKTEEEKKEFARDRESAKREWREAAASARDRYKVEEALRKLGDLPEPDFAKITTKEELDKLMEDVQKRKWADRSEYYRLIEILEEKDPKAAEQIQKDRAARIIKEEARRK